MSLQDKDVNLKTKEEISKDLKLLMFNLQEKVDPYFDYEDLYLLLEKNDYDVNKASYEGCLLKSRCEKIKISGIELPDNQSYWLRLANKYKDLINKDQEINKESWCKINWDDRNKTKIRNTIIKGLHPFIKEVDVFRNDKNIYGEKRGRLFVGKIKGYYHRKNAYISDIFSEAATTTKYNYDMFMMIHDDISKNIKKEDYFYLDGNLYKFVSINNIEGIIYDSYIKKMS